MKEWLKYFFVSFIAWLAVEFTTTEAIIRPLGYISKYMPALLIFYIGLPLAFSLLIYRFKLRKKWLFIAMLAEIVLVEIVFSGNKLFFMFPILLIAIPLSLVYYSVVTIIPLWISEGKVREHKRLIILILVLWLVGSLLNSASQLGAK